MKARIEDLAFSRLVGWSAAAHPAEPPQAHHRVICDALQEVEKGNIRRLIICAPPGSAKSTYASVDFPTWFLGRNPTRSVIAASHTQELADRFGRRVRNLSASESFGAVFDTGLSGDSQAANRWSMREGGEYYAVGIGGAVTGFRADLGLIDDPVKSRQDADSETIRDKTWEWYRADFRTRVKPGGAIVIILTRWHEDDIVGRVLPEGYELRSGWVTARDGEKWYVLALPAICEIDQDEIGRARGDPIWPQWFGRLSADSADWTKEQALAFFDRERLAQGERNWSALYQQRPSAETGTYFTRDWLRYYDEPPKFTRNYGASDYAVSDGEGDFTVHGVFGIDHEENIYVLDWWRNRTASDVWVESAIDLMARWRPVSWGEEKGVIEKSVGPLLSKRMRERSVYCHREPFPSVADKQTRAQSFRGRMAMGKVYLPQNAPWVSDLITELMSFPAGKNDDQVDVCALFGRMLDTASGEKRGPRQTEAISDENPRGTWATMRQSHAISE